MANKRISQLTALGTTPAVGDILPITDVDDTTGSPQGTTKGVTVDNLMAAAPVQTSDISDLATQVSLSSTELSLTTLINLRATQVSLGNHKALTSSVHGISAFGATLVDDANALTARTTLGLGTAATTNASDYATAAQGTLADSATQPGDLGTAASKDVGTNNGNVVELDSTGLPAVDGSQLTNLPSPDVDGPLTTALRGTDNPHIGAFPNQSFKVIDNPKKKVMVIATDSGDLDFLLPDGGSIYLNTPTGGRLAPGFGFSVVEDATEPDIEVTSGGESYSVISGDSDSTGPNGLPIRQGFNIPDIGGNQAPILISGGSIV